MAKVMLSLPDDLLAEIDEEAAATGRSRSGLLQHVFRLYQLGRFAEMPPGDKPGLRERFEDLRKRMPSGTDSTAEIRRSRDERAAKWDR